LFSALAHSLDKNVLTGFDGKDMSGILKLAEALPHSQLTSLRCMAHTPLELCMDFVPLLAFASVAFNPCTSLMHSVDGHGLPIDELKGTKPVESIDLSGKKLGAASGIIIGACIKENEVLKELKCVVSPLHTFTNQR